MEQKFRGTVVYEIDGICYYVTEMQDRSLRKIEAGPAKDKFIKKVSYAHGAPGEAVASPEGTGRTAAFTAADEEVEEVEEASDAPATSNDDLAVKTAPSVSDLMGAEEESGAHS